MNTAIATKPAAIETESLDTLRAMSVELHATAWAAAAEAGFGIDIFPVEGAQRVIVRATAGATYEVVVKSAFDISFFVNGFPTQGFSSTEERGHEAYAFAEAHMLTLSLLATVHDEIEALTATN